MNQIFPFATRVWLTALVVFALPGFDTPASEILIEAESFEGVSGRSRDNLAAPWSRARRAGMKQLAAAASGSDAIHAGAFTLWSTGTDSVVARTLDIASPGSYDLYARTYRDENDRSFQIEATTRFYLLARGTVAT